MIPVEIQIRHPIHLPDQTVLAQKLERLNLSPNQFNQFLEGELSILKNLTQCPCGTWKPRHSVCLTCGNGKDI